MVRTDALALVKKIKLPRAARLTITVLSDYLTAQHTVTNRHTTVKDSNHSE